MSRKLGIRRPRVAGMPAGPLVKASSTVATPTALPGGLALPAGSTVTDATSMLGALQARTAGAIDGATPLPRDVGFWALFGPGSPLYPSPLNTPNPTTGQQDPRRWEFPVSWNLTNKNRVVDWQTLRDAAEKVDIIRLCLETRKAELTEQEWDITVTARAAQQAGAVTPKDKQEMREQFAPIIDRLIDWWTVPDKVNDMEWSSWMMMLWEEYLVLDAPSVFPRMTYGGQLASLEIIDGSTIKPLLDEYGNTPMAPAPAYQQWLYGFPRGEYTAASGADWEAPKGGLIYKPRNIRTFTPYGYSVVEQALISAEIYLRRQDWMRQEYTAGTLPTTWLKSDVSLGQLTPEQYRAWNAALNDLLSGDTTNRHRNQLLPLGFDPVPTADAAERYRPEYDEFLIKLLCAHIGVPPEEIGFTQQRGLGGSGHAEAQDAVNKRKSIRSANSWFVDVFNSISRRFLGMPPQLTLHFLTGEAEDEAAADGVADTRVKGARMTFNEDRDRQGMPRYEAEWADSPMVMTATGPVWLDKAWEAANEPPAPVPPALAAHAGVPPDQPDTEPDEHPDGSDAGGQPDGGQGDAAKAELAAYRRFVANPRGFARGRPFEFTAVTKTEALAAGVDLTRVTFKAVDARGRGGAPAGARRGDRAEYAGYPIGAAGARP
jgi:hypothetical protein